MQLVAFHSKKYWTERLETFVYLYFLWLDEVIDHFNEVLLERICSVWGYCWLYICHKGFESIGQFQSCTNDQNFPESKSVYLLKQKFLASKITTSG